MSKEEVMSEVPITVTLKAVIASSKKLQSKRRFAIEEAEEVWEAMLALHAFFEWCDSQNIARPEVPRLKLMAEWIAKQSMAQALDNSSLRLKLLILAYKNVRHDPIPVISK